MSKFRPTRGEYRFRLAVSIGGLLMLIAGLIYRRDADFGPGAWEAIITTIVFFGGTAIWSVRQLWRYDD